MRSTALLGFSAFLLLALGACGSTAPKAPDTLKMVPSPNTVAADGTTPSTLTLTASNAAGAKLTGVTDATLVTDNGFFTSKGTTTATVKLATAATNLTAVGTVQFFCSSDSVATIKATLGAITATTKVTCGAGAGSGGSSAGGGASNTTIVLTAPAQVVAEANTLAVTATLKNSDGSAIADSTSVLFTASSGTWGGATSTTAKTTAGAATATYTAGSGDSAIGPVTITGTFSDTAGKSVSALLAIQVVDPTKSYVVVSSDQASLTTTGATATITATVYAGATPSKAQLLNITLTGPSGSGTLLPKTGGGTVSADSRSISGITSATDGTIQVTFIAGVARGAVTITVTDASVTTAVPGSTVINITLPLSLANAAFVPPSPGSIRVRGSSDSKNPSVAQLTFAFTDQTGQPAADGITVNFEVTGTHSQEVFVDPAVQTTSGGLASTFLNAGTQAETVVVSATASLNGITVSALSPSIAIVGGLPEYSHMSISCDQTTFEAPGLSLDGIAQKCTVQLADRFSNRVPAGTQVEFRTEAGNIDATLAVGATSVVTPTLISGDPRPRKFFSFYSGATIANPHAATTVPTKVQELVPEAFYNLAANRPYPNPTAVIAQGLYPAESVAATRNAYVTVPLLQSRGHVVIIAITQGEESFIDQNGNKQYDVGEAFIDLAEPFLDKNDNGVQDDCGTFDTVNHKWIYAAGINSDQDFFDCHEDFIDLNGDGKWNAGNGVWDASTSIWKSINVVWTSQPYLSIYPTTETNGGAAYPDSSADLFDPLTGLPAGATDLSPANNPAFPVAFVWSSFSLQNFIVRAADINLNCPHGKYGYTISNNNPDGTTNQIGEVKLNGGAATYLTEVPHGFGSCDFDITVAEGSSPPSVNGFYYGSLDVTAFIPSFNAQNATWPIQLKFP